MERKCPKCGADSNKTLLGVESWKCESFVLPGQEFEQSDKCRISELEQEVERLKKLIDVPPDWIERREREAMTDHDTTNHCPLCEAHAKEAKEQPDEQ